MLKLKEKKRRHGIQNKQIDYLTQQRERTELTKKRSKQNLKEEPHIINFKELAKKASKFDNKRMNHMVYLNHLSANRNVKKKGVKDSGTFNAYSLDEINFQRTVKSFEELKAIIKKELIFVMIDFVHLEEDQDPYTIHKKYVSKV